MACRCCLGLMLLISVLAAVIHHWRVAAAPEINTCPGSLHVHGHGNVELVASQWNMPIFPARSVKNHKGRIQPELWGRAYFATTCKQGVYRPKEYTAMQLLGKTIQFTTDVSKSGCGCNAAMYLVSMPQNNLESLCHDYYCDANSVCAVRCHEIDIMEANRYAFHSTMHKASDKIGISAGYGGYTSQFFNGTQYGPEAKCINTNHPFHVLASFPVDHDGKLSGMHVKLEQRACTISMEIANYPKDHNLVAIAEALKSGMTPVISYWGNENLQWLDGPSPDGKQGPCAKDSMICDVAPHFYHFKVSDFKHGSSKR